LPTTRSVDFWRSVLVESLASFLYVLLVCLAEEAVAATPDLAPASRWLHNSQIQVSKLTN
jgi:hypothetical protein